MFYFHLLAIHSIFRWIVLISLIFAIFRAFKGWIRKSAYSKFDNAIRHGTATIAHIQLIFGLTLYFISPITDYFLHHVREAVHQREVRFFGMEHSMMMILGIVIITIGSYKSKRRTTDTSKYKTMAIWFLFGLLVILTSIPWAFSPMVSRPYFRSF